MDRAIIKSKIGNLMLISENEKLVEIKFVYDENLIEPKTEILKETKKQLDEYFNGERKNFSIPFEIKTTEFMSKVYRALIQIPYGTTVTYKDIAKTVGNEKAVRAVGMANHKNKIPIIIPCHRVIGKNGKLVGFAGGIDLKQKLLELEGIKIEIKNKKIKKS
ncbi:MAG: methylated-DNA--[protein]-cysteine S-methyltransferase [Peptoniphilaceae bacterium]|uniref:methylated-DNA--[protein]-cysteine S-methyltransferase n=1 Tax=Parvimonas sp. TaxID=1944660 RepID=UPI002A762073|nr:methylated-DNA--[protein]-cysteine S-methyltransferase [Parvimonas sp.]MDD7765465.1 methylated-DNA--[protein]-cysteine S-methyltransferase [Peptoniphilaceae bacterium]MDY3051006.1 methylated-DNA--[protein]-cysteine S-methyltransferase [Parvimonas sp.]